MFEARISEVSISKEELVSSLYDAVREANEQNPNTLGVIFFGSRSQNIGVDRPDSDVDLIRVETNPFVSAPYALSDAIRQRLEPLGLLADFEGTIYVDWIKKALALEANKEMMQHLRFISHLLDENSVFIIPDPDVKQQVIDFVKPQERVWSRSGFHRDSLKF